MARQRFFQLLQLSIFCLAALGVLSCGDESPVDPGDNGNGGGGGPDTIPPAAVLGLNARTPTVSTIAVVWISPGDDGSKGQAAAYDLRWSLSMITEQNWDACTSVPDLPVPKPAGSVETVVVTNLPSSSKIYFCLKTIDEAQNASGLSNTTDATTLVETMAPAAVTDLVALAISDTEFKLTWTAPGDDFMSGTATAYDIRYYLSPMDNNSKWNAATQVAGEHDPPPGGSPDSMIVTGLQAGTNYHFAIKTVDEVDNWSGMSNLCPGMAITNVLWVSPDRIVNLEETSVTFRASPDLKTKLYIYQYYYEVGTGWDWHIIRKLADEVLPGGIYTRIWDTLDDNGDPINNRWEAEQFRVRLFYGSTLIEGGLIQITF